MQSNIPGSTILPEKELDWIEQTARRLHLSVQNRRRLVEAAIDLRLWEQPPIETIWDESGSEQLTGKTKTQFILHRFFSTVEELRSKPIDYHSFDPPVLQGEKGLSFVRQQEDAPIMGRCPVAGEKTRCCNLQTLDAVQQCGFACSYCSIQSFYDESRVYFQENLDAKLESLQLDPERMYHIGTGQSSDSLMWGNRNGLLTNLFSFASRHPNVLLELKTKSARTDWINLPDIPNNVIATWSLNTPDVISAEEHLTASLEDRIKAARTAADAGIPVGFHFHPIIWHTGWKESYADVIHMLHRYFSPDEVVMVSLGTLTFIKPVLKKLRQSGRKTRTTQIPLVDAAGKLSYPYEIKRELFSFVYDQFSPQWKEHVFFYLCMEDASLWEPVFGFSYPSNEAFESAMKRRYLQKIQSMNSRRGTDIPDLLPE
ncbi:MAG: radical SAM protein [Spirochaetota bacterium]